MADRKDFFRQMAAQYGQLAEIAGNSELKQRLSLTIRTRRPLHRPHHHTELRAQAGLG